LMIALTPSQACADHAAAVTTSFGQYAGFARQTGGRAAKQG
jgi:hypothetical protein